MDGFAVNKVWQNFFGGAAEYDYKGGEMSWPFVSDHNIDGVMLTCAITEPLS
jgi:hypothetical protein